MTPEIAPPKRSLNPVSIVLKEGTKVRQRQLVNEMLGPLVTEFARNLRARRPPLFSAASNPAFSVASRPSNSPDITRTPTSQRRPSARWSPVEHTRFKVVPANSAADEGPAAAAARPRRRGDRMSHDARRRVGVATSARPPIRRIRIKGHERGARAWGRKLRNKKPKAQN